MYACFPGESNLGREEIWCAPLGLSHRISRFGNQSKIWINRYVAAGVCTMAKVTAPKSVAYWLNRGPKTKKSQGTKKYPNFEDIGKLLNNLWSARNWHRCVQHDPLYPNMSLVWRFDDRFGHAPPRNVRHVCIRNIAIFEGNPISEIKLS